MTKKTLTICCVTDNKPGHKSQLDGLLQALQDRVDTQVSWIRCAEPFWQRLRRPARKPDLILAAGHRTHFTALLLKWLYRGKLVVLMKPSLPLGLFDYCIVPAHDGVIESAAKNSKVIGTKGVLNVIRPSENADQGQGLILIGGPSKHHTWSDQQVLDQLQKLKASRPLKQWTLTTSRRTPETFLPAVNSLVDANFSVVPVEQTNREWLLQHYRHCGEIWVSEDSVSMVYESLSSGARVGVLEVPRLRDGRVSQGLDKLVAEQWLIKLGNKDNQLTVAGHPPLKEAQRVAERLLADITT